MPYTNDPENVPADAVRLYVGDTNVDDQQFSDAEITYILSIESNIIKAAARAAHILAAKYARQVDSEIDEIRLRAQNRFDHYVKLADELDDLATSGSGGLNLSGIWFGGISKDEKRTNRDDEDLVQPAFYRRLHRNPGTGDAEIFEDVFDETLDS